MHFVFYFSHQTCANFWASRIVYVKEKIKKENIEMIKESRNIETHSVAPQKPPSSFCLWLFFDADSVKLADAVR